MAIVQTGTSLEIKYDVATDMEYNMQLHRLVPTNAFIFKVTGVNLETKMTKAQVKIVLNNMSNIVYGWLGLNMPTRNMQIVLALIAEDAHNEQITISRAFGVMANYALKGGDEVGSEIGIDFASGVVTPLQDMRDRKVSEEVKEILINGNGEPYTGLLKRATLNYTVEDVTDLVFGVDY